MKFGDELRKNMIPEWAEKYVQYETIAELIEKRSTALFELESEGLQLGEWHIKMNAEGVILLESPLKSARDAFDLMLTNLHDINTFFCTQGQSFALKTDQIFSALEVSATPHTPLTQERGFANTVAAEMAMAKTMTSFSKFNFTKEGARQAEELIKPVTRIMEVVMMPVPASQGSNGETSRRQPVLTAAVSQKGFSQSESQVPTKKDIHSIWKVFVETYRFWVYLDEYVRLNRDAYIKIFKKFDKHFHQNISAQLLPLVDAEYCFATARAKDMAKIMEELWVEHKKNEAGSRSHAMDQLRQVKDRSKRFTSVHDTFWVGIVGGMALGLACVALSEADFSNVLSYSYGPTIAILRCMGLGTLMMWLWGLNTYIWQANHINYHFIFELPFKINVVHAFQGAAFNTLAWVVTVYVMMRLGSISATCSIVFIAVMALVYLNPLHIFSFPLRRWFMRLLMRCIISGFRKVTFAEFWMVDQMVSMGLVLSDFQYIVCYLCVDAYRGSDVCLNNYKSWSRGLLFAVAPYLRLVQCLRKYRDDGRKTRNLFNALKYTISIIITIVSSMQSLYYGDLRDSPVWRAWVFFAVVGFVYSNFWDIRMDWGFFTTPRSSPHWPLRSGLMLFPNHRRMYYVMIVINVVLRMSWLWSVTNDFNWIKYAVLWKTVTGVLELFRRFMWNLVRVEYENTHNVENYRAVKELPLPNIPVVRELQPIPKPIVRINPDTSNIRKDTQLKPMRRYSRDVV